MTLASESTPLTNGVSFEDDNGFPSKNSSMKGSKLLRALSASIRDHIGKIGFLGSMSIAVNSLTGPAMLNLPSTYQRAGLIPTTLTVIFVCIISALCCLHMANTISKVPGNSNYKKEIEYSETFQEFWGHRSFVYTQILFFCCVTCLNVSSIVDTAQVVDTFVGHWFPGGTGALQFTESHSGILPNVDWLRWDYSVCTQQMMLDGDCVPFGDDGGVVLSLGYIVTFMIFVPLAVMDLKENASVQVIGFLVLIVTSLQFIYLFGREGLHIENLSLWGERWDTLFGIVLFNFALVIAIPAWLYEKEPHVDVPAVIHSSSIMAAVLYIFIGILGAMTMPDVSQNMLESMMSGIFGPYMQICASIFAFFIIGLGCPLFSVLARMNLTGSGLVGRKTGNILAVYMPFSMSWLFYQGEAITQLLSWGGIIFTSLVAFVLPILIALHSIDTSDSEGVVEVYGDPNNQLSKEIQKKRLKILLAAAIISISFAILGNIF